MREHCCAVIAGVKRNLSHLHELVKVIRTTRNWYLVLLSALLKRHCVAHFRDGNRFLLTPGQLPNYLEIRDMVLDSLTGEGPKVRLMTCEGLGQVLDVNGCKFIMAEKFTPGSIGLFMKLLSDEDFSGYEVIDVGAYTGDTAVCFASKGAIVHAYEPVPDAFAILSENVGLNGMQGVIAAYNCAVGQKGRTMMYADTPGYEASSSHRQTKNEIEVESISIEDALKRCRPDTRKLLKLNCEGCEFDIISPKNAQFLSKFQKIICFYHSYLTGTPRDVILQVMQVTGFRAVVTGDQRYGFIIAQRS